MAIRIVATNFLVPETVQTSAEVAALIGKSVEWVQQQSGVNTRHVSAPHEDDPAVFAARAARPVINKCGPPDLVLYCGVIPRQMLPDTSPFLHRELGLEGTPCFSVNAACLSFLVALKTADAFIKANTYRRILICCAELASRGRNFDEPESAALMGDGAAAVMVEADESAVGFEAYRMQSFSEFADLTGVQGGGTKLPPDHPDVTHANHQFHMRGDKLLRATVPRLRRFLSEFLGDHGLTSNDIRLVVPHQPSGPGFQLLQRWGFEDERVVNIVARYGNCVAASMPMALAIAELDGRIQRGDRILFLGTAAGISIGGGVFQW